MKEYKHIADEMLITFAEGEVPDREERHHLDSCDQCRGRLQGYQEVLETISNVGDAQPPAEIKRNLANAIQEEQKKLSPPKTIHKTYWQLAAAVALLVVGFISGRQSAPDQTEELIALRSQVDLLKEMSTVNALQVHSASERIQAVNNIENQEPRAGDKLIGTLIATLNTDESPNVRYAAAQALSRFIDQEDVRLALAKSLERQSDALIQLTLISMLVEAQEKTAVRPIEQIIKEENNSPEVKIQAKIALEILS